MNTSNKNITIIGAGVSGLVAAICLEKNGFSPIIVEATNRVGGRVKTDEIDGYQLDHGFQILLTSYPLAKKYLDYSKLELQFLLPGASIFQKSSQKIIGDPLRNVRFLIPTLTSGIGTTRDKLKILKLNTYLKRKSIEAIFSEKEQTTRAYLEDYGFSSEMINNFFSPFFSGIFLESELKTSSRMFEFIYKMFGNGHATIPKNGMEAIPKQLKAKLKTTRFIFNTKATAIRDHEITLDNGDTLNSDATIITIDPNVLVAEDLKQKCVWKSCDTLYFETPAREIHKPLIGLIPEKNSLINNIFYHTSVKTTGNTRQQLLSVTIIKEHGLSETELMSQIQRELRDYCGIKSTTFLKRYHILKALPNLTEVQYEKTMVEINENGSLFPAGDISLNGSLNAAMLSGENAALAVIKSFS